MIMIVGAWRRNRVIAVERTMLEHTVAVLGTAESNVIMLRLFTLPEISYCFRNIFDLPEQFMSRALEDL